MEEELNLGFHGPLAPLYADFEWSLMEMVIFCLRKMAEESGED